VIDGKLMYWRDRDLLLTTFVQKCGQTTNILVIGSRLLDGRSPNSLNECDQMFTKLVKKQAKDFGLTDNWALLFKQPSSQNRAHSLHQIEFVERAP
jgi:hypothetical protein